MLQRKRKFRELKRQNQRRLFWQRSTRSLVLVALLFVLSLAVPPIFAQVSLATAIVQTQSDAPSLVNQGKQLYNSGQFEEAARVWHQAADAFAVQGNSLNRAMALSNLSLTYQQLGNWERAKKAIANSLNILQTLEKTQEQQRILAQTLDIQGQLQQKIGRSQAALETWQQAVDLYANIGDSNGETISQINRALAMQDLGLYPRACKILLKALDLDERECQISDQQIENLKQDLLEAQPSEIREARARGLRSLGNVLRVIGSLEQSQKVLLSSLEVAQSWNSPQDESKAWLNLGNIERALAKRAEELQDTKQASTYAENALANYQQAASSPTLKLQAQLNQLELLIEKARWQEAQELSSQVQELLAEFPVSRGAIYVKINLARNLVCLIQKNPYCLRQQESEERSSSSPLDEQSYLEVTQLLQTAVEEAKKLDDKRSQSYAVGILGRLYENLAERDKAQEYTEQALKEAWQSQASDLIYQWQWQLGRLLAAQEKLQEAIAAYRQAVKTLQSLRNDLVAINPEIQFTFRESVEPVYREYVGLLLQPQETAQASQENLKQAREAIDSLQLAELENFFQLICLDAQPVVIDQVTDKDDPTAAIIYPILLTNRFEIILKLPQQPALRHYTTPIGDRRQKVERILERLAQSLTQRNSQETLPLAQQVYDWLLRDASKDLTSNVKTLVFVLDSPLRNIPMAVLHDGQKYLVEKYGIALTPGLQLLDPQPLERGELRALAAGLTEARGRFPALKYVADELAQVRYRVSSSVELFNREFTNAAFQNQINALPFPVVHLATHGQFSSQAEATFILTWDGQLDVNQLNDLLRSRDPSKTEPIELLVLSACETLTGDKRAALGLAGVAVRAGARSTLATLWSVNDEATAFLMGQFYEALKNPTVTKAEALRRAQLTLLGNSKFDRPHFWAPYVLVGNWL